MRVYAYLRASTKDQDASRAEQQLQDFAKSQDITISTTFTENVSGASLKRPELFKLLDVAESGDILLVEQVDRLSRLNEADWNTLKSIINDKKIKIVSLDLPTSHGFLKVNDEFTSRMFEAINNMMLDMLSAISRKDYEDRQRRSAQGRAKAKAQGKYVGRKDDKKLQENIKAHLINGKSYTDIMELLGCSRGTIAKVSKALKQEHTP